ncbi:MAG: hypothetical protein ACLVIY_10310 [Anaerobutyricum soehngenii]
MDKIYDVVIIGGDHWRIIQRRFYCARAGLSTMVLESMSGRRARWQSASQIDNYPGGL